MWKLEASERVARWRDFRKKISNMSAEDAILAVVDFWATCPFTPYYLEDDQPDLWPNPWNLLVDNYYCDLAKCLGIVYTITLTPHVAALEPEIHIYQDAVTKLTYHLVILAHGKYVINLLDNEIVNITSLHQNMQLQYQYTQQDLTLE